MSRLLWDPSVEKPGTGKDFLEAVTGPLLGTLTAEVGVLSQHLSTDASCGFKELGPLPGLQKHQILRGTGSLGHPSGRLCLAGKCREVAGKRSSQTMTWVSLPGGGGRVVDGWQMNVTLTCGGA